MMSRKKVLWLYDRDVNVCSYNRSSEINIFNVNVLGCVKLRENNSYFPSFATKEMLFLGWK